MMNATRDALKRMGGTDAVVEDVGCGWVGRVSVGRRSYEAEGSTQADVERALLRWAFAAAPPPC